MSEKVKEPVQGKEEEEGVPAGGEGEKHDWVEIASATLLSLAMIATAWCAYQAARWSGVQAIELSQAAANRDKAARAENRAGQDMLLDASVFLDYAILYLEENVPQEYLDTYEEHLFSNDLERAMKVWLATDPLNDPEAPKSPFEMPEYVENNLVISEALSNIAENNAEGAKKANQQSDNYVLLTVLFAIVLFFAGVATKFNILLVRIATICLGGIIFYVTALSLLFQSIH
ncbi:MAG: hypothetical protein SWK76_09330 [Actinomycetota bacterium]|nr:hypothetical protein [Actinomycetota bacterium]